MARWCGAAVAAVMMAGLVVSATGTAQDKGPTAKDVMKAVAGKTGLCAKCNAAGKAGNWDDAQKLAKQLNECGVAFTKSPCPRGDGKSWEKLTAEFCAQTAAINKAAEAKDSEAFAKAIKTFVGSCEGCHTAHKAKK